jgi:hypothetical protein
MLCETEPFILKMHGKSYIDDYEGILLKKTQNYMF